jgi:hypothetical protein
MVKEWKLVTIYHLARRHIQELWNLQRHRRKIFKFSSVSSFILNLHIYCFDLYIVKLMSSVHVRLIAFDFAFHYLWKKRFSLMCTVLPGSLFMLHFLRFVNWYYSFPTVLPSILTL